MSVFYPVVIRELPLEDGGGFHAIAMDLFGCMSDGATAEQALVNVQLAIIEWIDEAQRLGRDVPRPGSAVERTIEAEAEVDQVNRDLIAAQERLIAQLQQQIEHLEKRPDRSQPSYEWTHAVAIQAAALAKAKDHTAH